MNHLVQVGILGSIGRFRSADRRRRPRGTRVICRTDRGLEVGTVLKPLEQDQAEVDGDLLRRVTPDDRMLINRIDRFRDKAFLACQEMLNQHSIKAILVEVEHLFDGQSIYFYFLGEVTDEVNALTDELADVYEAKVRFRKFSEKLAEGCGPDCGTGDGGCGSNCGSCAIQAACKSENRQAQGS